MTYTLTGKQRRSSVSAVDQLERNLSVKTSEATAEGQANVQGYVAQAKNLANSAIATAQVSVIGSGFSYHRPDPCCTSHIFPGRVPTQKPIPTQMQLPE